jgi:hypothetical protein
MFINLQVMLNVGKKLSKYKAWLDLIFIKFFMINYTLLNFLGFFGAQFLILIIQRIFQ